MSEIRELRRGMMAYASKLSGRFGQLSSLVEPASQ
jgi:hypothetical protein